MITWFKFIVFLHVVSAIVWIGAAIVLEILDRRATRSADRGEMVAQIRQAGWFGSRVFGPASGFTILTGILGVIIGRPAFGDFWVIVALVAVAVGAVVGGVLVGRSMSKLAVAAENPNASQTEIEIRLAEVKPYSFLSLSILIYILFDMVMRPDTADKTFIIISIAYFVLVLISMAMQKRKASRLTPHTA